MANYGLATITNQGKNLYSKAQSGVQLNFTKIQIGNGSLPVGTDPKTLTALIGELYEIPISFITVSGANAYLKGIFDNTNVNAATYVCEIGVFANDPDLGEILYAYANAGTQGDTIPAISTGPFSRQFQINTAIGNATNVTITIPANTYVPTTDVGVQGGVGNYNDDMFSVAGTGVNAITGSITGLTSYFANMKVLLGIQATNTGPVTLSLNGLGIASIKYIDSNGNKQDCPSGMLKINQKAMLSYDGADFVLFGLQNVKASDISIADAGNLYTAVNVEDALQEIAGVGRTTETVKGNATTVSNHLADSIYQTAGGTATALTLTIKGTLSYGYPIHFIASAANGGAATTINGKYLYKPGTTTSPNLIAGKAYEAWYNSGSDCFFIKASAEGNTIAAHVLAGDTFSNDSDTGIVGTMPNKVGTGVTITPTISDQAISQGYYGGALTDGKVKGDVNLIPSNILSGKSVFGVNGNVIPLIVSGGSLVIATPKTPTTVNKTFTAALSNAGRVTAQVAGTYRFSLDVQSSTANTSYYARVDLFVNGVYSANLCMCTVNGYYATYTKDIALKDGDYVDIYVQEGGPLENQAWGTYQNYKVMASVGTLVTISA